MPSIPEVRRRVRELLSLESRMLYWERVGYEPHPGQLRVHMSDARFKASCNGRRWGKALALDTPLPTPDGWTTMGDVRVGDRLFDEEGCVCHVTFATEIQLGRECYEVEFSDGTVIVADADHLWLTWDKRYRKALGRASAPESSPAVRSTREIASTLWAVPGKEHNHSVPLAKALNLPARRLPVPPYTLGAWLGDGNKNGPVLTCSSADNQIVDEIISEGITVKRKKPSGDRTPTYLLGEAAARRDSLTGRMLPGGGMRSWLRDLGVLGKKRIPHIYLRSSVAQRTALLQGLMDTDGYATDKGHAEFTTTNAELAGDFLELVTSLGMKAVIGTGRATLNGTDCGPKYRVKWTPHEPVFRLERKLRRLRVDGHPRPWTKQRYICDVRATPSVPVRCIEVDSPSHMYLAGRSMIPTHNTVCGPREIGPLVFIPDTYIWVVGPTQGLAVKEFRVFRSDLMAMEKQGHLALRKNVLDSIGGRYLLEVEGGATIEIRSQEKEDQIVGEGLTAVIMAEAARLKPHIWEELVLPTLSDYRGVAVFSSTPRGRNWYYQLFQQAKGDPEWATFNEPSWNNTHLFPGGEHDPEIEKRRANLPEDVFAQEWAAEFVTHSGLVYPEFSDKIHVVEGLAPLPEVPIRGWVDVGFHDPFVCLAAQEHDGKVRILDEYYRTRMTPSEHAGIMAEHFQRIGGVGYVPEYLICDPRSPDGIKDLKIAGWQAKAAPALDRRRQSDNPVIVGVKRVKQLLKRGPDGEPRLLIHPRCVKTIEEFGLYEWVDNQPDPKNNNHCMDAIRYGVVAEVLRDGYGADADDEEDDDIPGREEPDRDDCDDPDEPFGMQVLRARQRERERLEKARC